MNNPFNSPPPAATSEYTKYYALGFLAACFAAVAWAGKNKFMSNPNMEAVVTLRRKSKSIFKIAISKKLYSLKEAKYQAGYRGFSVYHAPNIHTKTHWIFIKHPPSHYKNIKHEYTYTKQGNKINGIKLYKGSHSEKGKKHAMSRRINPYDEEDMKRMMRKMEEKKHIDWIYGKYLKETAEEKIYEVKKLHKAGWSVKDIKYRVELPNWVIEAIIEAMYEKENPSNHFGSLDRDINNKKFKNKPLITYRNHKVYFVERKRSKSGKMAKGAGQYYVYINSELGVKRIRSISIEKLKERIDRVLDKTNSKYSKKVAASHEAWRLRKKARAARKAARVRTRQQREENNPELLYTKYPKEFWDKIRVHLQSGLFTVKEISQKFNVSKQTISAHFGAKKWYQDILERKRK